jgi:hypothetical protein
MNNQTNNNSSITINDEFLHTVKQTLRYFRMSHPGYAIKYLGLPIDTEIYHYIYYEPVRSERKKYSLFTFKKQEERVKIIKLDRLLFCEQDLNVPFGRYGINDDSKIIFVNFI